MGEAPISDRTLVELLLAIESGLTTWEIDFIESIDAWVGEHEELTEQQRAVAERILNDKG